MLKNHASDASGNGRYAPFLSSNSRVTEESLDRAKTALKTFKLLGRCSASIACFLFAFVLVMSSAARMSAQTSGTISGHVADTTGAAVPDTKISLKNVGTGSERTTVTTGSGDYTFTEVPVGVYKHHGHALGLQDRRG